jgi:hypothetical protein
VVVAVYLGGVAPGSSPLGLVFFAIFVIIWAPFLMGRQTLYSAGCAGLQAGLRTCLGRTLLGALVPGPVRAPLAATIFRSHLLVTDLLL